MAKSKDSSTKKSDSGTTKQTIYAEIAKPRKIQDKTGWTVRPENKKIFGSK